VVGAPHRAELLLLLLCAEAESWIGVSDDAELGGSLVAAVDSREGLGPLLEAF